MPGCVNVFVNHFWNVRQICRNDGCLSLSKQVIYHAGRNIDPGGVDAVAEFHGVIDLDDRQAIRSFKQVNGQQPPANYLCSALAQSRDLGCDGAVAGLCPPRAVLVIQFSEVRYMAQMASSPTTNARMSRPGFSMYSCT